MGNKEQAVRDAASALYMAIADARLAGLHVEWPSRAEDLTAIAISETGATIVTAFVTAPAGVSDQTLAKATAAASAAAAEVVSQAPDRPLAAGELDGMTKAELLDLASQRGVEVGGTVTKAELIEALKAETVV